MSKASIFKQKYQNHQRRNFEDAWQLDRISISLLNQFTEMLAHSVSSRSHLLIIYIIILMHTHIPTVLMIRPLQEILPDVRVDLDVCYNVTYYTHFLGEINCRPDCTLYNYQDHKLIRYSPEKGWQFQEKPFVCMCSCNFNTKELRNGYVVGNGVVSHESYLNYTCNPGFKKTTLNRIMCLDGIFVSVEIDDTVELPELIKETPTIFREYPLSKKDFSQLSNSVHKFVIDSDNWTCNGYPALKGFVHKVYNNKVPYKLLSNQEETCYKDGHIDVSRHREIGCIKEIMYTLIPMDPVQQNLTIILPGSIIGIVIVIFFTVGIRRLYLARRRVSKSMQIRSIRECDPQLSIGQQESAPTSSGEFCRVVSTNKYYTYLTGSVELYPTETSHLFYSKSGKCRIAILLTPKNLRKNLSSDDFSWTIDSKYLEDDSDGVEYLPEESERPQCSSTTENINSWSRHISKRSKSESDISEKDLESRNLYTRSHSDSIKPTVVCTVMEENNPRVVNEDQKEESSLQLEMIDESVKECTVMEENNSSVVNEDRKEQSSLQLERINKSVEVCKGVMYERLNLNDDSETCKENATLQGEDNVERETTPLITDTNNMKHDDSSVTMLSMSLTEDGKIELQNRNGCTLNANNSKSDMNLCDLSSKGIDPYSSRRKSDSYILKPSLLEKAWKALKKKFLGRNDSHIQSFLTRIEIDCI